jgi:hypothetical protein
MIDDEMNEQMRRLAQSYNEPPATPREAMWERIESARSVPVPIGVKRSGRWLRTAAGIAAVLVVGIAIGRITHGTGSPNISRDVVATTRHDPADSGPAGPRTVAVGEDRSDPGTAPTLIEPSAGAGNPVRLEREDRIRSLRGGRGAPSGGLAAYGVPDRVPGAVGQGSDMNAYRLAVVEHMARTEVLLTSFRAQSRNGAHDAPADAQFASLAKELLKNTRLLLATRTSDDPTLTRLLEDLELVLMQISQYTAEGRRGDLDAINQSLDRRNVLPKLRSTIPAGASASAGT